MSNILYITICDLKLNDGVSKKIKYQIKALKNLNNNVQCVYASKNKIYKYSSEVNNILTSYKNLLEKRAAIYKESLNIVKNENVEIIYIRYFKCDLQFLLFLKNLKKSNRDIKILIEIPTYPYDGEVRRGLNKYYIFSLLDKFFRKKLKLYVDKIVTFSVDQKIFGIPCINICNGIDLNEVKLIEPKVSSQKITFTSVSSCYLSHGIDRLLKSLDYFKLDNLKFNIVGEGPQIPKLKKMVEQSEYLKDCVVFLGHLSGESLDLVYNETNIAVGSLGRHRDGVEVLRTLKTVEYTAKGLPTIFSEIDPGFINMPFIFKVESDESLINLIEVIEWRQSLSLKPNEIREYAKDFSMENQMERVVSSI